MRSGDHASPGTCSRHAEVEAAMLDEHVHSSNEPGRAAVRALARGELALACWPIDALLATAEARPARFSSSICWMLCILFLPSITETCRASRAPRGRDFGRRAPARLNSGSAARTAGGRGSGPSGRHRSLPHSTPGLLVPACSHPFAGRGNGTKRSTTCQNRQPLAAQRAQRCTCGCQPRRHGSCAQTHQPQRRGICACARVAASGRDRPC